FRHAHDVTGQRHGSISLQDAFVQQAAGKWAIYANVSLSGKTRGRDFPAHDFLPGDLCELRLDCVTSSPILGPAFFGQFGDSCGLLPMAPQRPRRYLNVALSHPVSITHKNISSRLSISPAAGRLRDSKRHNGRIQKEENQNESYGDRKSIEGFRSRDHAV